MRCHHVCTCGAELTCRPDGDNCPVGPNWTCQSCELDAMQVFLNDMHYRHLLATMNVTKTHYTNKDDTK